MPLHPDQRRRARIAREADAWHARMLEPSSEAEVEAFEAWLNADPEHPRAYAVAETNSARATRLPRRLLASFSTRSFVLKPVLGAALVAGVAMGAVLWLSGGGPGAPGAAEAALSNPGPGIRSVRLQDGSLLKLDTGATLSVLLNANTRRVRVRSGRTRFAVARDPRGDFAVIAQETTIRAQSGVFDVTASGAAVRVQVVEGAVQVTPGHPGAGPGATVPLESGQALEVTERGVQRHATDPEAAKWPDSRISFIDAPLAEVVAAANRGQGPAILLENTEIGGLKVSGVLDLRDPVSLARKLATALDLRIEDRSGAVLLTR